MPRSLLDIHGIHIDVHSALHFFNSPTPDTHIASALELGFQFCIQILQNILRFVGIVVALVPSLSQASRRQTKQIERSSVPHFNFQRATRIGQDRAPTDFLFGTVADDRRIILKERCRKFP